MTPMMIPRAREKMNVMAKVIPTAVPVHTTRHCENDKHEKNTMIWSVQCNVYDCYCISF